jgi:hypothetical protein
VFCCLAASGMKRSFVSRFFQSMCVCSLAI